MIIGDSITVSSLLGFLYTLDYDYRPVEGHADGKLLSHVNVYIAADFYDVPRLKEVAATKFQAALVNIPITETISPKHSKQSTPAYLPPIESFGIAR